MTFQLAGGHDGHRDDVRLVHQREHGHALQATEWKKREMFLRLALLWATAAQQSRKEASTPPEMQSPSIAPGDQY